MNRKDGQKIAANGSTANYSKQSETVFEPRPSYSGFQSFLKWFRKNERDRIAQHNSTSLNSNSSTVSSPAAIENDYHHNSYKFDNTAASSTNNNLPKININGRSTTKTPSPISSSPALSINGGLTPSSSCDSVFSTATTGFAFIPPNQYRPFGELSQPEKLIAPGPTTDTYRTRLQAHRVAREINKNLTLRTKYKIFDSDTLISNKSNAINSYVHPQYTDLSLPQTSDTGTHNDNTINRQFQRKKSHRRTVSDSSKDRKAGAYVHVKGKRKAPRPPIEEIENCSKNNTLRSSIASGTLSPGSTLGRSKKRRAPPPPLLQNSLTEEIPTVLADGLFDDDEIKAIMSGDTSTAAGASALRAINMDRNEPNVASTDTLKLERGQLKSNREQSNEDNHSQPLSPSAISPRPWYKRSPAANKDYAIPFKKEITLRTMDKRKTKQMAKEIDSPQLPEVGFCRNSSLFDGFFARATSEKSDDSDKRRSGIGMPNISELDREAAEIISKEQQELLDRAKKPSENDHFYLRKDRSVSNESHGSSNFEPHTSAATKRTSTKDLISKFEKTNHVKLTLNSAYIDQSDRTNCNNNDNINVYKYISINDDDEKQLNKVTIISSATTTSSSSSSSSSSSFLTTQSISSNVIASSSSRHTKQIAAAAEMEKHDSAAPIMLENSINHHVSQPHQYKNNKTVTNNNIVAAGAVAAIEPNKNVAATKSSIIVDKKVWICSYCTLENQYWRVICEVCERFRPYDRPTTSDAPVTTVFTSVTSLTTTVVSPISKPNPIVTTQSSSMALKTSAKNEKSKDHRSDWETKAEKVMKYFRPKSSGNTLSKSASETSVGKSTFSKKSVLPSKLLDSPKFKSKFNEKPSINGPNSPKQPIEELVDSSEVVKTTVTTLLDSGIPTKQTDKRLLNIEEVRMARLARFSDCSNQVESLSRATSVEPAVTKLTAAQLNDPESLEKEKKRLREMIRAMNARALAEKYPVIQKSYSLDETAAAVPKHSVSTNNINATAKDLPTNFATKLLTTSMMNVATSDKTKTGAIKKLFNRKVDSIDDKEISDSSNYSSTKSDKEKLHLKVSSFAQSASSTSSFNKPTKPDVLLLPSPIQELNEDEKSPSVAFKDEFLQTFLDDTMTGHIDKDLQQLEEISQQFHTQKGLEDFKATLRTSSKKMSNTNTLALNKILKNLETAIANGEHEKAAELAMDLAKMKVSLSVTKQKICIPIDDETTTGIAKEIKEIIVDLYIEDKTNHKGPISLTVTTDMSILNLKQKVLNDFHIPTDAQRWILNNRLVIDDTQNFSDFGVANKSPIYLYVIAKEQLQSIEQKKILNIVQTQFNNGTSELGAQALPLSNDNNCGTLKIGWTCPLCTLINSPNRPGCVACSENRPIDYCIPDEYKRKENAFDLPDELKKFLNDDIADDVQAAVTLRKITEKSNDLNKISLSRKSTELFNIIVHTEPPPQSITINGCSGGVPPTKVSTETKNENTANAIAAIEPKTKSRYQTSIIMTAITTSPNITKNKYRGVDNYNPHVIKYGDSSQLPATKTTTTATTSGAIPKPIKNYHSTKHNQSATSAVVTIEQLNKSCDKYVPQPSALLQKKKLSSPPKIIEALCKPLTNSKHYKELLDLDSSDAIVNVEPFECPICFTAYECTGDGVTLRNCLHTFCKECIVNTIKYSEEAEIKCPFRDVVYSCDSLLSEREIKALVTKDQYEQHLAVSLRLAENRIENAFHCKTPNCRGWCIYEDNVNLFKCPICKIDNCLTCRVIHDGLNCKQYQDRMNSDCDSNSEARRTKEMLAEMIEKGDAMNCPTCQVVLMKKWGCDWLKCSMCKTEICWVTRGVRWGPEGKGDTSAGCKCGVNGVKCHPKCNYCH